MGTNITGIGNANAIGFKSRVTGGAYFPPELKDALVGVWSAYGKSNDSTDRNIIKNKIKDKGGDFVISNAAFKLNSGFGGFVEDFTSWDRIDSSTAEISNDGSKIKCINTTLNVQYLFNSINRDIPSFKVKISNFTKGDITYYYRKEDGIEAFLKINPLSVVNSDKVIELPKSYNTVENGTGGRGGFYSSNINIGVTITQIPSFEGAFVTDGIDDLITSTKTVQEMLGGSNELTIVSMVHQVKDSANNVSFTNYIRGSANGYFRNIVNNYDKTGIYGYTSSDLKGLSVVNNILGDKNDYTSNGDNRDSIINGNFSVQGYSYNDGNNTGDFSSVAWYWTFIANKVLTTDQINQVIAYFNLDRTLKPDILCNTIKQGITNENHAEFGDKLIDFSDNGRDIQLNNIAWKGDSGIGKYATDFTSWLNKPTETSHSKSILEAGNVLRTKSATSSMKVKVQFDKEAIGLSFRYFEGGVSKFIYINSNGEYSLPPLEEVGVNEWEGFSNNSSSSVTITQIPSHAGALCLDGVNDFGKVTGMPVYKDYTVIADYERFYLEPITGGRASILSKSSKVGDGSFIFNLEDQNGGKSCYTFGEANGNISDDITRIIRYQSKYYNTKTLSIGTAEDNDFMVLGKVREVDSRYFYGAIYSLMSFPYSMSEFLIERQLKKHKLGTLYPDMVEWRPIITINGESGDISYANNRWENINIGDYVNIGEIVHVLLYKKDIEEISNVKVDGAKLQSIDFDSTYNHWNINIELTSKSPQKINITIDEYIRYEDIVQPYPVLLRFKDENGNEVSWGGKFKVGSTITRIGSIADPESNLLNGLYSISGLSLNGKGVTSSTSIVEKQMVFKTIATYLLDNNEPKCILSPRLLRIPNSSYKILGHIPDISGHGNHGKINNSAYKLNSGVNGYLVDFTTLKDDGIKGIVRTDSKIYLDKSFNYNQGFWLGRTNNPSPAYKVKVSGIPETGMLTYTGGVWLNLVNGINELPARTNTEEEHGFVIQSPNLDWSNLVIEQIGEYEGSICFDGVDDYMDIPSLSIGGKQVLMKTNWLKSPTLLYDQRASGSFAILTTKEGDANNPRIAYQARNQDGKTYIDGIENNYIETYSLKGITHNITVTNPSAGSGVVPVIGANTGKSSGFAKMVLYDFMLFDEVSTDEEIKQLNDIVGIEGGYVQKPPYYWDAYGKTNSDDDRSTIQQRGTAVGDYDITNYNHAYEGMSGYNGYPAVFGTNKTYANLVPNDGNFILTSSHNIINVTKFDTSYGLLYSHIKLDGKLTSRNIDYPSYKIKVTGLGENFGLHYSYLESSSDTTVKGFEINNDGIYIIPKSFASDGSLTSNSDWIGFIFTGTAPESCNVTIEVLPEYENGLVYDGVDDYSENTSIPAFTDYTYIIKYEDFNNPNTGSCIQRKGSIKVGGGAFVQDHIYRGTKYQYNFGISSNIHKDDSIAFCTKTNYNGTAIPSGNNTDDTGFTIGKFDGYRKMVFYKEMLYPRTVNMLTINMIKNMMAEDGIIDIQGKLFTDKFTGDFNLDFNKDFLIGN